MGDGHVGLPRSLRAAWGGFVLDPNLRSYGTQISSVGVALPDQEVRNDVLEAEFGLERGWIRSRTGIAARRKASAEDTVVSLATAAASDACARCGVDPQELDHILVATCSADDVLPPVAPRVAHALGASGAAAADVGGACAGSLVALVYADALVATGAARRVMIVGSEILSRLTARSDARTAVLFGDGAGALLVERSEEGAKLGPFRLYSDGSRPELLWAGHDDRSIHMRGLEVYKRAVEEMTMAARRAMTEVGATGEDIDLVLAHQANQRILDAVGARLGLEPSKMYSNISRYGNTSAASIPIALRDACDEGLLRPGGSVLLVTFGAGFVWGAGMIDRSTLGASLFSKRSVVHAGC